MAFPIKFTLRDRELLLDLLSIEPDIVERLNNATIHNNSITINVDSSELELLLGAIAADANHAENRKLEKELDSLFNRADKIFHKKH